MKNEEIKPDETVFLVNIKSIKEDGETLDPKFISLKKSLYLKHLKINAEYLNDYVLCEDPDVQTLKVIEDAKPIEKNDLTPKKDAEKPLEDPLFNDPSNDFEPFIPKAKESFIQKSEKPSFDKPKKERKQRIKAN